MALAGLSLHKEGERYKYIISFNCQGQPLQGLNRTATRLSYLMQYGLPALTLPLLYSPERAMFTGIEGMNEGKNKITISLIFSCARMALTGLDI